MTTQRFNAAIEKTGSKTVLRIPFNPNEVWGAKERHDVTGTVNGIPIRGSLKLDGEQYLLPIGPAWQREHSLADGAVVSVELTAEGPQADQLSTDITAALAGETQAQAFFESLPTFYRKNYIRWIESAKRPETRAARIQEMVDLLKVGKRQK